MLAAVTKWNEKDKTKDENIAGKFAVDDTHDLHDGGGVRGEHEGWSEEKKRRVARGA